MKISFNWLKDYVDIKLKPQELADKLTMAGLEVTSLEENLGDWILELEITSNRPDLLSLIGIAREVSAITGKKLKLPKVSSIEHRASSIKDFAVKIEDKKACPKYSAQLIRDVKVVPSPNWLKQRLEKLGLRPVNNIVDITNFCLMEMGQPLHAFDFDKIKGSKIIVRRAKSGETIKTIDGQEIKLTSEILVIADLEAPIAVAGVMGGLATEVTENSKNILLESAYFNPILIRRASRLLGITSESSYRFERGVDLEKVLSSSNRAVNLVENIAGGRLIDSVEKGSITKVPHRIISLLPNSAENLLGIKIKPQSIKQILTRLQFKLKTKQKSFKVEVPNFRQDIKQEVDLIEEVARIYGFPHLPLTQPPIKISSVKSQPITKLKDLTRQILISAGFNEIISYSLISRELLSKTNLGDLDLTPIANPLSKEQEILTPSIIPSLLNALNYNLNRGVTDLKLFEINKNYLSAKESYVLGLVMTGEKYIDWLRGKKERIGFFDLKGVIEVFLERLGISRVDFVAESLVVFANCAVLRVYEEKIGILGELSNLSLSNWDIRQKEIFLAEINLEKLLKFIKLEKSFTSIISLPSVRRDISLILEDKISAKSIFEIAKEVAGFLLQDLKLVELYAGGQIPKGFKGITLSLEYQAKDKTLTDSEVNALQEKICQAFQEKLQAKIR